MVNPCQGCHIQPLAPLFHHRWAVPVAAELHRVRGARVVTLVNRLGVTRDSLRQALAALADLGLAMRNPGYGHPLRPEYILTAAGEEIAPACQALVSTLDRLGLAEVGLRKWSMPLLHAVGGGPARFSALKVALPGISARALALALMDLQAAGLVERRVLDSYPPATLYTLTPPGQELASLAAPLLASAVARL